MSDYTMLWSDSNEHCAVKLYYDPSTKRICVTVLYKENDSVSVVSTHIPDLLSSIKLCMRLASGERDINYFLENKDYYLKGHGVLNV